MMKMLAASQIATHPVIEMISALTTLMLSVLIDRRYQMIRTMTPKATR